MRARRVFCLLLAVILLAALLPQALAAGLIETDRPVTLTVRFFHDKAPVSGALLFFTAWRTCPPTVNSR
ncbi:MAG: hypothetical protein ACLT1T_02415 [Oscillospiraceae bacterium]